jgi:hypothetical protein
VRLVLPLGQTSAKEFDTERFGRLLPETRGWYRRLAKGIGSVLHEQANASNLAPNGFKEGSSVVRKQSPGLQVSLVQRLERGKLRNLAEWIRCIDAIYKEATARPKNELSVVLIQKRYSIDYQIVSRVVSMLHSAGIVKSTRQYEVERMKKPKIFVVTDGGISQLKLFLGQLKDTVTS